MIKTDNQHTKLGPGMPASPYPAHLRHHFNLRRHSLTYLCRHPNLRRHPNLCRYPNVCQPAGAATLRLSLLRHHNLRHQPNLHSVLSYKVLTILTCALQNLQPRR